MSIAVARQQQQQQYMGQLEQTDVLLLQNIEVATSKMGQLAERQFMAQAMGQAGPVVQQIGMQMQQLAMLITRLEFKKKQNQNMTALVKADLEAQDKLVTDWAKSFNIFKS